MAHPSPMQAPPGHPMAHGGYQATPSYPPVNPAQLAPQMYPSPNGYPALPQQQGFAPQQQSFVPHQQQGFAPQQQSFVPHQQQGFAQRNAYGAPSTLPVIATNAGPVDPALGQARGFMAGKWSAGGALLYIGAVLVASGVAGVVSGIKEGAPISQLAGVLGMSWAIGGGLLFVAIGRWKQSVTIFDNGIHHKKLVGAKTVFFKDVKDVRHEVHVTTSQNGGRSSREHVFIDLHSGKTVCISDLPDLRALSGAIRKSPAGG